MKWPVVFALLTGLFWGTYGSALKFARDAEESPFKPYVMIGVAYLVWGIVGGLVGMKIKGDTFQFTKTGSQWGFIAGSLGAFGALSLTFAMFTGGVAKPQIVMPIVFGSAVTVSALASVLTTKSAINPKLYAGIAGMAVCIVVVAYFTPVAHKKPTGPAKTPVASETTKIAAGDMTKPADGDITKPVERDITKPVMFALLTGLFWGTYGAALAKARSAEKSPFKPYVLIGVAYLVWGIVGGLIGMKIKGDAFAFTPIGSLWGFIGGSVGAFGALALTAAMYSGGTAKPQIVMPIVFGSAVTVSALVAALTIVAEVDPRLYAGIAGMAACIVTVAYFTPHDVPHKPAAAPAPVASQGA